MAPSSSTRTQCRARVRHGSLIKHPHAVPHEGATWLPHQAHWRRDMAPRRCLQTLSCLETSPNAFEQSSLMSSHH